MLEEAKWLLESKVGEETVFRIGRQGDTYLAEWLEVGMLRADTSGAHASFVAEDDANAAQVERIRRHSVPALLGHLRGELSLHGSALVLDGACMVFLGASGAGKSTLAAYLCRKHGATLIADDISRLRHAAPFLYVEGQGEDHALMQDAAAELELAAGTPLNEEKRLHAPPHRSYAPHPVSVIVLIGEHSDTELSDAKVTPQVQLTRLLGVERIGRLLPHVIRFAVDDPKRQASDFDQLAAALEEVTVWTLSREKQWDTLPLVAAKLTQLQRSE
jgi:hypothetical protein